MGLLNKMKEAKARAEELAAAAPPAPEDEESSEDLGGNQNGVASRPHQAGPRTGWLPQARTSPTTARTATWTGASSGSKARRRWTRRAA